jgi:hypothetical protein
MVKTQKIQNDECRMQNSMRPRIVRLFEFIILYSAFCISLPGCMLLGVAANAIPQNVQAKYSGLKGQSVGIVVWCDRGIMIDWNALQLDLANNIETKLKSAGTDEVKGIQWPYPPASYVRWLRDHPGSDSWPITEIAPRLGITRLIYVEVHEFHTRSVRELELFRGEATAALKIIETTPGGSAHVAYSEDGIHAVFPRKVPPDGLPNIGDAKTYAGTVDFLATEVVKSLITHEEDAK